jgi:alkylation response protein AidB-like acyl-CoA dehydrogenase
MLLSDDHITYRDEVRRFMERVVRPTISEYDLSRPLTRAEVDELQERFKGYDIAVTEPQQADGTSDLVATGIFTEELSRIDCSLAAITSVLFFNNIPMGHLLTDEQVVPYGHLFGPGKLVAVGLSEPNSGSNPSAMETTAVRSGDGWVINGQKLWTSNATISDAILVACRLPEEGNNISIFIVTRDDYAYDPRPISCLGMNGISTCEVFFTDCHVPAISQIGRTGEGLGKMLSLVGRARLNISFTSVGIAQAALDLATQYAKDRIQFGKPIGSFQLVQELLVDMAIDIDAGRLLALRAAAMVQAGMPARIEVSMAKAFCTEMGVRAASNGVQIHGGIGLTRECRAEQFYRDARMQTIPDGTTQIHKLLIGRELLGLSAFT